MVRKGLKGGMMDILDELHSLVNIRQYVSLGLERDATEGDIVKALIFFEEETKVLHEIAKYLYAEQEKGKCQNKKCPHYALGQANGCTIYPDITICVDSNKGAK
jgi:hypothetical protein